jgi:hypothetical protein
MKIKNYKEFLNEGGGYTKVQDELEELIKDMDKRAYDGFAGEYDIDPEDAAEMMGFITDIPDKDAKRVIKDIKKGLYEDNKVQEANFHENDLVRTKGGIDFGDETFVVIHQKGNKVTVEDDEDETRVFKATELEKVN